METRRLIYVLTGIAVAVVVLFGVIFVATSGGGDDNSDASANPDATGADLPDRVTGELRLFGGDPITLDPACASDAASAEYIVELFSGLVTFDKDLNIIPDIAETYDVNGDGTVYTFHLRHERPLPRRLAPGHR